MAKLKLSELADETKVSHENTQTIWTAAKLRREIIELGEPHHKVTNWYTVKKQKWSPDANRMVENYIENESDEMYEDWDERAIECITDEIVAKIQSIMDEAFKDDYATTYWSYETSVEIDVFP